MCHLDTKSTIRYKYLINVTNRYGSDHKINVIWVTVFTRVRVVAVFTAVERRIYHIYKINKLINQFCTSRLKKYTKTFCRRKSKEKNYTGIACSFTRRYAFISHRIKDVVVRACLRYGNTHGQMIKLEKK